MTVHVGFGQRGAAQKELAERLHLSRWSAHSSRQPWAECETAFYTPNFLEPDRHAHESMLSLLTSVKAALWDEAPAEQRKLTMQLGRNSLYFATAVFFIKQFGEQVAV